MYENNRLMIKILGWAIFVSLGVVLGLSGNSGFSLAKAPLSPDDVPAPLKPWVPWILDKHDDWGCPFLYNDAKQRICAWPSRLILTVTSNGGSFVQEWNVIRKTTVTLPGERAFWPQQVSRNSQSLIVRDHRGRPTVELPKGKQMIRGSWKWTHIPESLLLPKETALLDVTMNNNAISFPQIDTKGRLWFRPQAASSSSSETSNTLEVRVFRKLIDEIPFRFVTQLQIIVGGQAREIVFADIIQPGMQPLAFESPIPVQIDTRGKLRLQARAGEWTVTVTAASLAPIHSLTVPERPQPWPAEEIWVVDARPALRVVEITGGQSVDPQQTLLPEAWQAFPAYVMTPGTAMTLTEQRRGNEQPGTDRVALTRELWLDFDGQGYTVRDQIQATLAQAWRLTVQPSMQLGRVELNGQPHVITRLPKMEQEGVEVRRGEITMVAESRMEAVGPTIPALGWDADAHSVSAALHVPPGWRVLHAGGVDQAVHTWITQWTLLDMFLVLIAAVAVARLWSWPWGILAGLTLALVYHEPDAPVWVWGHVLAAVALVRVLPSGWWNMMVQGYRLVSVIALLAIALPFIVQQVRVGLYPQLEYPWQRIAVETRPQLAEGITSSARETSVVEELEADRLESQMEQKESRLSKRMVKDPRRDQSLSDSLGSSYLKSYAPDVAIQTGPGLPRWEWNRVDLHWSGPVARDQQLSIWYLSPSMTLIMLLVQVVGVGILLWRVLDNQSKIWPWGRSPHTPKATVATAGFIAVVGAIVLLLSSSISHAEIPSPELLKELEERLLAPPSCLPACADIPILHLTANAESLRMRMTIHAHEPVAVPIPGSSSQWRPHQIFVNGKPATGLSQIKHGQIWVDLLPGHHQVVMEGALPNQASLALSLPLRPHKVTADVTGWTLHGIGKEGVPENQVHLRREKTLKRSAQTAATTWQPQAIPPLVQIIRTIHIGLEWSMQTVVQRLSPKGSAFALSIPLVPGETVMTERVTVKDNQVQLQVDPHTMRKAWQSQLTPTAALLLTASTETSWVEIYRLDVSPLWHPTFEGIPAVHPKSPKQAAIPEWRPWPGESITVRFVQPVGVEGATFTVESSHLTWQPGQRATDGTLMASFRSSQGRQHSIQLPQDTKVESVTIDGTPQPIHQDDQLVTFPLRPGQQTVEVTWQELRGMQTRFVTSPVDLGIESVNAQVTVSVPPNRWVLWVNGPSLGPAVLLWGILIVMIGVAVVLGRLSFAPLPAWQWILLGLGLSQIPILAALAVVGWFSAMAWRRLVTPKVLPAWSFNLLQISLAFLTLLAGMCLIWAIQTGLVGQPDMGVIGNGSSARHLEWFQDRADTMLPQGTVVSLPLWVYRVSMLLWALWLALAVVSWIRWGWQSWTAGGYWQPVWRQKIVPPVSEPSSLPPK